MYTEEEAEKIKMNMKCRRLLMHFQADDDYSSDYYNYRKFVLALHPYVREKALETLKYLIRQYELQIDECAYLHGGRYLQCEKSYDTAECGQIISDLKYIGMHIPAYAMIREGRMAEAEYLLEGLGRKRS